MALVPALARLFLEAVAPLRCAGCDQVSSDPVCPACTAHLQAQLVPSPFGLAWGRAHAGFTFEGEVREILHRGKFQGNRPALRLLATLAAARLQLMTRSPADAIAAIPLGARRRRQRGYNQAEVVAAVFAEAAGLPVLSGLVRERETPPQASRGEDARQANVAGAFAWRGAELGGAVLWLIDDVLTTGATLGAAASVVRHAGARRVEAFVIARVP